MLLSLRDSFQAGEDICDWVWEPIWPFFLESDLAIREKSNIPNLDITKRRTSFLYFFDSGLHDIFWMILIEIEDMILFLWQWYIFKGFSHSLVVLLVRWLSWFLECLLSWHVFHFFAEVIHYLSFYFVAGDWPKAEFRLGFLDKGEKGCFSCWGDCNGNENKYFFSFWLLFYLLLFFFILHRLTLLELWLLPFIFDLISIGVDYLHKFFLCYIFFD